MLRDQFNQFKGHVPTTSERELALYEAYFDLLKKWNEHMSLVSPKSLDTALGTHFADSLFLCDFASSHETGRIYDFGSGAGFPGLVHAIRFPDRAITLFEKSQKKQSFLLAVISTLGLGNVTLEGALPPERFDGLFFARAVMPIDKLLRFFRGQLKPGALLVTCLGGATNPDDQPLPSFFLKVAETRYTLPQGCGDRRAELLRFVPRGTN